MYEKVHRSLALVLLLVRTEVERWEGLFNIDMMMDAKAAIALLEKRLTKFQSLKGIRTHDLCVSATMLFQLSNKNHMRAIVHGYYNNNNNLLVFPYIDGIT